MGNGTGRATAPSTKTRARVPVVLSAVLTALLALGVACGPGAPEGPDDSRGPGGFAATPPPTTGPTAPAPTSAAGSLGGPSSHPRLWAVANEGGNSHRRRSGPRDARTFDLITAHPGVYDGQRTAMRRVNPHVQVLGYLNGALVPPARAPQFPERMFARDAQDDTVASTSFGNLLMNPADPGWVRDRVEECRRVVEESRYDGCMLDVLGVAPLLPGYVTEVPVDPVTGRPYTEQAWLRATSALAAAVEQALGDDALVIANGLDDADRYFSATAPSAVLLDGVDGGVAENWLRGAREPLSARPGAQEWLASVEMVEDVEARGRTALLLTKAWAPGEEKDKRALHEFALATFLLAAGERSHFEFSYGEQQDPTAVRPLDRVDLGQPVAVRGVSAGVHLREFSRGLALVNPTDAERSVDVAPGYVSATGEPVGRVVVLPPRTGRVLLTPQPASSDR